MGPLCALLLGTGLDVVDSLVEGTAWGLPPLHLRLNGAFLAVYLNSIASERQSVQWVTATTAFTVQLAFMFWPLPSLG